MHSRGQSTILVGRRTARRYRRPKSFGWTALAACIVTAIVGSASQVDSAESLSLESLSSCVVFLQSQATGNRKSGTGFLVAGDVAGDLFLVTAEHVASTLTPDSVMTIRAEGDKPLSSQLRSLSEDSEQLRWTAHETADVDVLRLHVERNSHLETILARHFLPPSTLTTLRGAPPRSLVLTVLGFPFALGVDQAFSPISRETKPASGLLELPCKDTPSSPQCIFFLTQDPSVGGFSGAPIFDLGLPRTEVGRTVFTSPHVTVVGLVHGTLSDATGGKMGAIVPSFYIVETLKRAGFTFPTATPRTSPSITPAP